MGAGNSALKPPRAGLLCPECEIGRSNAAGLCPKCMQTIVFGPAVTRTGLKFDELTISEQARVWPDGYHVYVNEIEPGSASEEAGIEIGHALCFINDVSCRGFTWDDVLTEMKNTAVTHKGKERKLIFTPLTTANLKDGMNIEQLLQTASRRGLLCPVCKNATSDEAGLCPKCTVRVDFQPDQSKIGLKFDFLTEKDRAYLWPDGFHVYVEKVQQGSISAEAGVEEGMALCAINETSCRELSKEAALEALKAVDSKQRTIVLTPLAQIAPQEGKTVQELVEIATHVHAKAVAKKA